VKAPDVVPPNHSCAAERIKSSGRFTVADIDLLCEAFRRFNSEESTPWDDFRDAYLDMPEWIRLDLDPMSEEYAAQQRRLWNVLAGIEREYDPQIDEETSPPHDDPIRFPGFFLRRDKLAVKSAADHFFAAAMIMKNGSLEPGDWALEYGAGFAHTALQLARLGVNVDTIDISEAFCRNVKAQADFYRVPLTPFPGRFGSNPRQDKKYDLIWFYESFHHCLEFRNVVRQLKRHLAPTGSVILAGEPIARRKNRAIPFPWGLRFDAEVVAVMRLRHWFELGFTEDFIVNLFTAEGFVGELMECSASAYGRGYVFRHRGPSIELGTHWSPLIEGETWHGPEKQGRWTKGETFISLDASDSFTQLKIDATNHHPHQHTINVTYGHTNVREMLRAGEHKTISIDATVKSPQLVFRSNTMVPAKDYERRAADGRALGIFISKIRYI
jgi:2-polyprenyl-3-methyl-5-hydroxy-6-metoxy-1,4-benzoquinol methylase